MQADIKELRVLLDLKDEYKEKDREASEMRKLSYNANDRAKKRLVACIEKDNEILKTLRESIKKKEDSFADQIVLIPEEYKANNIGGIVDHSFFRNLPVGIEFKIDGFPSDWIRLRAEGYGVLEKGNSDAYGSGALAPSFRDLVEFFESTEGKKKKRDYKRMWNDLKGNLKQYGKLINVMTDIEDQYE